MADSKIDFSFENLHFSCEGDKVWVEKQLNNVLSRIPSLLSVHKKGENIVEEVIEIREEDIDEVKDNAAGAGTSAREPKSPKSPSVSKSRSARKTKGKSVKSKVYKVKTSDSPAPTMEGVSADSAGAEAGKSVSGRSAGPVQKKAGIAKAAKTKSARGRKSPKIKKPTGKGKTNIQGTAKAGMAPEQVDSPLSRFIREKKVDSNQVRKFLATAVFLAKSNNVTRLTTPMISKALKSYGIPKLRNASDCLNKNEKRGFCLKEGKEFIITESGYQLFA